MFYIIFPYFQEGILESKLIEYGMTEKQLIVVELTRLQTYMTKCTCKLCQAEAFASTVIPIITVTSISSKFIREIQK